MWFKLARHFSDYAIAPPPLVATLEYRGRYNVDDQMNRQDTENLRSFLKGRGYVGGETVAMPAPAPLPLSLTAMEVVIAERSGPLAYHVGLGDVVASGDVLADLIIPDGPDAFVGSHPVPMV